MGLNRTFGPLNQTIDLKLVEVELLPYNRLTCLF